MLFGALVLVAGSARGATEEVWEGDLKVSPTAKIRLVFNITKPDKGPWTATMDSPDQGATGLPVEDVSVKDGVLTVSLTAPKAEFSGKLNKEGTEAVGEWKQGPGKLPLTLKKTNKKPEKVVGKEELWEGKLKVAGGIELRMVVHIVKPDKGAWAGTLDSPDQGAKGLKIDTIGVENDVLSFKAKTLGVEYSGKLNKEGTEAVGEFKQGGAAIPLTLKKTTKLTELKRPQTPKPPFPYRATDVTYRNEAAKVKLAGTLTEPEGQGPFPAVILISGSGAQDRDESLLGHKPFLVLADYLTRRSVAVLRVDDRGVGGSSNPSPKATTEDFAGDVLAGVAFLKSRPEIDPAKIGLIGHSEGGLIAPMVAVRSSDVAFIVLMAGTGLPGDEILRLQAGLIAKAMGAKDDEVAKSLALQRKLIEIVKFEKDQKAAETKMRAALKEMIDSLSDEDRKKAKADIALADGQIKQLGDPWFRFFLTFDPRPTLAKVRCPVLALVGEKDLQVPPKENLSEIAKALKEGKNACATIKELPGLNHLFQTCRTGAPGEYANIEETISPTALTVIGEWVAERVNSK